MSRARDLADSADLAFDGNTLKIDSTNNRVGIGTDSPSRDVHIKGAGGTYLRLEAGNGTSYTDIAQNQSASRLQIMPDGTNYLSVNNNGDISFYEDTGTTAKLFWDASEESLTIGDGNTTQQTLRVTGEHSSALSTGFDNQVVKVGNTSPSKLSGIDFIASNTNGNAGTIARIGGFNTSSSSYLGEITLSTRDGTGMVERMRIDSSGNVGIGVTPKTQTTYTTLQVENGVMGGSGNSHNFHTQNAYYNSGWKYYGSDPASKHHMDDGKHYFQVASSGTADSTISWTDAMTINNNGKVGMGKGGANAGGYYGGGNLTIRAEATSLQGAGDGVNLELFGGYTSSTRYLLTCSNVNGATGGISNSGTSTSFITSSDYRLKENVVDMEGAIDRVKALQPKRFNFIADADTTVDGFLAHEVSDIVPEAISGEKDATETYTDDDGVEQTRNVYQAIDQSKLVPLLTGALQEAIAKIEALEIRIETLEGV